MKPDRANIFRCTENLHGLYRVIAMYGLADNQKLTGFETVKTQAPWPNFIFNAQSENHIPLYKTENIVSGIAEGTLPPWWISGPMDDVLPNSEKLREIGFRPVVIWPAMVLDLSKTHKQVLTPHTFCRIVANSLMKDWWNRISVNLFDEKEFSVDFNQLVQKPDFYFFTMCDGENMVATCMVYVVSDFAGIYMVTVDKAFRHQGVASAMISNVLDFLQQKGIMNVYLQANKASFSLYKQLGFNYLCDYTIFWNPGGKQ